MQSQMPLFFILLFLSVFLISQALILPSVGKKVRHKQLIKRLKDGHNTIDAESVNLLRENALKDLNALEKWLIRFPLFESIKKKLELAGITVSFSKFLFLSFLAGLVFLLVLLLLNQIWYFSVGAMFAIWVVEYIIVQKMINDRLQKFEEQLPEALDIIKRVLQAGQPLNKAFYEVGIEMPGPLGPEFLNTYNLLNYGYDLRLAILQMSERTPTISMLAFSSAVLLQKETGGNLTENLDKLSRLLRARFKLSRKIRTISAESRMSAWVLVLAPFGLYAMIYLINPEYIQILHSDPRGLRMIGAGMIALLLGTLWIRKIVNIEV